MLYLEIYYPVQLATQNKENETPKRYIQTWNVPFWVKSHPESVHSCSTIVAINRRPNSCSAPLGEAGERLIPRTAFLNSIPSIETTDGFRFREQQRYKQVEIFHDIFGWMVEQNRMVGSGSEEEI